MGNRWPLQPPPLRRRGEGFPVRSNRGENDAEDELGLHPTSIGVGVNEETEEQEEQVRMGGEVMVINRQPAGGASNRGDSAGRTEEKTGSRTGITTLLNR